MSITQRPHTLLVWYSPLYWSCTALVRCILHHKDTQGIVLVRKILTLVQYTRHCFTVNTHFYLEPQRIKIFANCFKTAQWCLVIQKKSRPIKT